MGIDDWSTNAMLKPRMCSPEWGIPAPGGKTHTVRLPVFSAVLVVLSSTCSSVSRFDVLSVSLELAPRRIFRSWQWWAEAELYKEFGSFRRCG